jgi:hypothetical protein
MPEIISTDKKDTAGAQIQLDGLVVNIELTLISIIQGVALSFLADRSSEVIVGFQLVFWPYAVTGLLIILLFWSRSLIHTLTVIRWPLELSHNFLYVACTLIETVAFTQLTNPLRWYGLNALFGVMTWILFALDLRMVRRRISSDSAGSMGNTLYALVEREQFLNIKYFLPATVVFHLVATMALWRWTGPLIDGGGHAMIALAQLGGALCYLIYVMRFFTRIVPMIVKTRQEWRGDDSQYDC